MLLFTSPRFEEHVTPPGHPERMERAHVFDAVAARWKDGGGATAGPRAATRDELSRVHDGEYLDTIAAAAGRAVMLDPDTFTSPESVEIAQLAAGTAVALNLAEEVVVFEPSVKRQTLVKPDIAQCRIT